MNTKRKHALILGVLLIAIWGILNVLIAIGTPAVSWYVSVGSTALLGWSVGPLVPVIIRG